MFRWLAPLALTIALSFVPQSSEPARAVTQSPTVTLRIRPRVGDTLRMRFEQVVEAAGPATDVDAARTRTSSMNVASRSVVERADAAGTVVLTTTDSATFETPGADPRHLADARRAMRGRWVRMRISTAGAMELLAPPPRAGDGVQPFDRLPGTLPPVPVAVGATWTREMALPWGGTMPADGGRLQVVFRFDSLGGGGRLAYVSMHGALARAGVGQRGARVATSGTMRGYLLVDLKRGWMTDSHATFTMLSTMTPAPGAAKGKPMRLRVTVTQRLHCTEP